MANLSVENLNKIVQTGDVDALMGAGKVSESRVVREMQSQGMNVDAPREGGGVTFSDMLRNSVDQVNDYQHQADTAIKELVAGRSKNIHETMLTIERADTSLKLMTQVRNKILEAYKEIMRMQV
jgi:flagellar hook-basal body complex protein FliE